MERWCGVTFRTEPEVNTLILNSSGRQSHIVCTAVYLFYDTKMACVAVVFWSAHLPRRGRTICVLSAGSSMIRLRAHRECRRIGRGGIQLPRGVHYHKASITEMQGGSPRAYSCLLPISSPSLKQTFQALSKPIYNRKIEVRSDSAGDIGSGGLLNTG